MTSRLPKFSFPVAAIVMIAALLTLVGPNSPFRAGAAPGPDESAFVPVDPVRILDTRAENNVGLAGPFSGTVGRDLQVAGEIPTFQGGAVVNDTLVPAGASGVVLNVTGVSPTVGGFISVRPADATGVPTTSSLNLLAGEIVPGDEFYSYDDKYVTDGAQLLVPAPLRDAEMRQVRELAVRVFTALRCEGLARVDFFFEEGGRGFLCNEANTMPGFTPISMYPKLWLQSGMTYAELIDRLVELALERHARRRRNTKH